MPICKWLSPVLQDKSVALYLAKYGDCAAISRILNKAPHSLFAQSQVKKRQERATKRLLAV